MGYRQQQKPPVPLFALTLLFLLNLYTQFPSCVNNIYSQKHQQWDQSSTAIKEERDYAMYLKLIQSSNASSQLTINATEFTLPDPGLEALTAGGYPTQRVSDALPEKMYLIYGVESSGTKFVAEALAGAVGLPDWYDLSFTDTLESNDNKVHFQHLSLPSGSNEVLKEGLQEHEKWSLENLSIVPVYYPTGCRVQSEVPSAMVPVPRRCRSVMGKEVMTPPHRYFVNITSHVQWYRERGVKVYPVMVVRDPMFHFSGILAPYRGHCQNPEKAYEQYEQGRAIMAEALNSGVQPLIVSYETLLTLQMPYLQHIYFQLGIVSKHRPSFVNGNTKKLYPGRSHGPVPHVEQELIRQDGTVLKSSIMV